MERNILIVGGGVAGLTAGILLARKGFSCEIIEQNAFAGGNLCGWERNGCTIDNCVHWLTGTAKDTPLWDLWHELGALSDEQSVRRLPVLYTSSDGKNTLSFGRDLSQTREAFRQASPEDAAQTDRLFDAVERLSAQMRRSGLLASVRTLPALLRYGRKDLRAVASGFRSPLLQNAVTDLLTGEYDSLGLLFAYAAFVNGNADLPAGGSAAMAKRMAETFCAAGGVLRLNTKAQKLLLRGSKVCAIVTDKGAIACDGVILAADPAAVFGKLLPLSMAPAGLSRLYRKSDALPTYSALQIAFETDASALSFSGILGIPIRPLCVGGELFSRLSVRSFAYEPSFAPEGKAVLQTMLFLHRPSCRKWIALRAEDPARYRERKEQFADAIRERIEEALPALQGKLSLLDVWSPASYHRYFSTLDGSFMSPAITGKRLPITPDVRVRGISNLALAGQWYRIPGGLPSAARSGKYASELLEAAFDEKRRLSARAN